MCDTKYSAMLRASTWMRRKSLRCQRRRPNWLKSKSFWPMFTCRLRYSHFWRKTLPGEFVLHTFMCLWKDASSWGDGVFLFAHLNASDWWKAAGCCERHGKSISEHIRSSTKCMRNDLAVMALNSRVCTMLQLKICAICVYLANRCTYWLRLLSLSFFSPSIFQIYVCEFPSMQRCHWTTQRICVCKYLVQCRNLIGSVHRTVAPKLWWREIGKYVHCLMADVSTDRKIIMISSPFFLGIEPRQWHVSGCIRNLTNICLISIQAVPEPQQIQRNRGMPQLLHHFSGTIAPNRSMISSKVRHTICAMQHRWPYSILT